MKHSLRTISSSDFHALAAMADSVGHIQPHKIRLIGLAQLAEMNYLGKVFFDTVLEWLPISRPEYGEIYRLTWNEEFKCPLPLVHNDFWAGHYDGYGSSMTGGPIYYKWEAIRKLADSDSTTDTEREGVLGVFSEFLKPAMTSYKSREFGKMLDLLEKELTRALELQTLNRQRVSDGLPEFESWEAYEVHCAHERLAADDAFQAEKRNGSMGGDLPEDYDD